MSHLPPKPDTLKAVYSLDMVSDAGRRGAPSDKKPLFVSEALLQMNWPIELIRPEPASIADLCLVHEQEFVEDVLELRRRNGFGSVSQSVARSLTYTCGACYCSALIALEEGVAASLTSGFHHSGPSRAAGFCTFNGLMTTTVKLLVEQRVRRVAILDCDYHYGDGTQAIIDKLGLASQVLHLSFGAEFKRPDQADAYLERIGQLQAVFEQFRPDLIIYQAGADVHVDDPLGGLLTRDQMQERDRRVFSIARAHEVPIAWNLAGGYQVEPDGSIPRVVRLHLDTFEQALRVWGLHEAEQLEHGERRESARRELTEPTGEYAAGS